MLHVHNNFNFTVKLYAYFLSETNSLEVVRWGVGPYIFKDNFRGCSVTRFEMPSKLNLWVFKWFVLGLILGL